MFTTIATVAVILVAAVLGLAATKPSIFRVQRMKSIQAPPDKILALIEDFHNWESWSPYEKLDVNLKRTYTGAAKGRGAVYAWEGNSKAGAGRMEIIGITPSKLTIKLDFVRPFEGHNTADFILYPKGDSTDVTWVMHGPQPYARKVLGTFLNMDRLIGKAFEEGLANLKAIAETQAQIREARESDAAGRR
jgi:hypothetical protein